MIFYIVRFIHAVFLDIQLLYVCALLRNLYLYMCVSVCACVYGSVVDIRLQMIRFFFGNFTQNLMDREYIDNTCNNFIHSS